MEATQNTIAVSQTAADKKLRNIYLRDVISEMQEGREKFFGAVENYANIRAVEAFQNMTQGKTRLWVSPTNNILTRPWVLLPHMVDEFKFFGFLVVKIWAGFFRNFRRAFENYVKFVLNAGKEILLFGVDALTLNQRNLQDKTLWLKENTSLLTRSAFLISAAITFSLPTCPSGQIVQLVGEHAINLDDYIEEAYEKRDDIAAKVEKKWGEAQGTIQEIRNGEHGPKQLWNDVAFTTKYLAEQGMEEWADIAERAIGVQNSDHWEHNVLGKGPGIADKSRRVAIAANFALASVDTLRERMAQSNQNTAPSEKYKRVTKELQHILNDPGFVMKPA